MAELYGGFVSPQNRQLGERFMASIMVKNRVGTPLPDLFVSTTFTAYDSLNNAVIPTVNVATYEVKANKGMRFLSPVDCRPNQQITTAGVYRFVFSVKMSDGDTQVFEQQVLISANP